MDNTRVSLAVMDALGRLGIAHDIMELEPTPRVRAWQEGLVRLALRQGKNLTDEERTVLEDFLQGGNEMKKTRRYWAWTWTHGRGMTYASSGEPVGALSSYSTEAERLESTGTSTDAIPAYKAYKALRACNGTPFGFDSMKQLKEERLQRALTNKELLELWDKAKEEEL